MSEQVREYVRQWCEDYGKDFDEVADWLERTSYEEELEDLGYVEQVLDSYCEGENE